MHSSAKAFRGFCQKSCLVEMPAELAAWGLAQDSRSNTQECTDPYLMVLCSCVAYDWSQIVRIDGCFQQFHLSDDNETLFASFIDRECGAATDAYACQGRMPPYARCPGGNGCSPDRCSTSLPRPVMYDSPASVNPESPMRRNEPSRPDNLG